MSITDDDLARAALEARENAYAPYSDFKVGAALLAEDGTVYTGCNVENSSYGLCICAERVALGTAVAAGRRRFRTIAIATGTEPPSPPCGMCRQSLAEFGLDLRVLLVNPAGQRVELSLADLLPYAFSSDYL